ncbi:MAG: hypothetical protein HC913_23915, partial [Microscillaceae bacterium]|nr:hypothetical protein [Microscillaceae bacterium]
MIGRLFKWSFRIILIVFLLRVFAAETPLYQAISPFAEPFFEGVLETLTALMLPDQTQEATKEVKIDSLENNSISDVEEKDYQQIQEFDAVMPCQSQISYVTHLHKWEYNHSGARNRQFGAKFTILPSVACQAEQFREKQIVEPRYDGSMKDYYGKVYLQLVKDNRDKLAKVYKVYEQIGKKYQLDY